MNLYTHIVRMASNPSGKKRARQSDFLASFSGPRIRPNPNTLTRIDRSEDGLKTGELSLPVPTDTQPATFYLLEPLKEEVDPIDELADGEGEVEEVEEVKVVDGKGEKITQVCQVRYLYRKLTHGFARLARFSRDSSKLKIFYKTA